MNQQLRRVLKEQDRIQELAKKRMIKGERRHGRFNPETDRRNFYKEMKEEALDIRNYADMLFMQIEAAEKRFGVGKKKAKVYP